MLHFSDSTVASEMKTVPSAGHSELGTRSGWDPPIPEHRSVGFVLLISVDCIAL